MGWGNFLVIAPTYEQREKEVKELREVNPVIQVVNLRRTRDAFMSVIGTDCGMTVRCNKCLHDMCAGCGDQFVVNAAPSQGIKILCQECTGNSIWDIVKLTYVIDERRSGEKDVMR